MSYDESKDDVGETDLEMLLRILSGDDSPDLANAINDLKRPESTMRQLFDAVQREASQAVSLKDSKSGRAVHSGDDDLSVGGQICDCILIAQNAIQQRAYSLWVERGCPYWDDLRDWYKAERQLLGEALAITRASLKKRAIEKRAFALWLAHDCQDGDELSHWLAAEEDISRRESRQKSLMR